LPTVFDVTAGPNARDFLRERRCNGRLTPIANLNSIFTQQKRSIARMVLRFDRMCKACVSVSMVPVAYPPKVRAFRVLRCWYVRVFALIGGAAEEIGYQDIRPLLRARQARRRRKRLGGRNGYSPPHLPIQVGATTPSPLPDRDFYPQTVTNRLGQSGTPRGVGITGFRDAKFPIMLAPPLIRRLIFEGSTHAGRAIGLANSSAAACGARQLPRPRTRIHRHPIGSVRGRKKPPPRHLWSVRRSIPKP